VLKVGIFEPSINIMQIFSFHYTFLITQDSLLGIMSKLYVRSLSLTSFFYHLLN